MSLRLRALNLVLRLIARPILARATDPVAARPRFDRVARVFRRPPFLLHLPGTLDRVTVRPKAEAPVILYFHGGAYLTGSPMTHLALAGRIARLTGLAVHLARYRLAPEFVAPAAFEDAVAAHATLKGQGFAPNQIILAGDSAGGGLALALLSHLCLTGQQPAGLFALSPWTDLELTGDTLRANAWREALIPPARMAETARMVRGALSPRDPRISPLYAPFPNPPPVLLQVGSGEVLLDDSRRMAEVLKQAGGQVTLQIWPECPHVWQILDGWLPEARMALCEVARFVASLSLSPPTSDGS
jgi:monoterpene epsilon-lactone hydrolase